MMKYEIALYAETVFNHITFPQGPKDGDKFICDGKLWVYESETNYWVHKVDDDEDSDR